MLFITACNKWGLGLLISVSKW